jgi:hypothetical protein
MPLSLLPPPLTREDALTRRIDSVSSRVRRTVVLRSGSWLIALAILFVGGLALLDSRFQLPSLVRALGLAMFLVGTPILFRRWVLKPLAGCDDPVQTALRIERAYPEFNDSLVSAVQFSQMESHDRRSSSGLRNAAIRRAWRKSERFDLDRAVNSRWLKRSILGALIAILFAASLAFTYPAESIAALKRFAIPFGGAVAPTKTKLEIVSPQPLPHRMARGEPLDIRVRLGGAIPDRVAVAVKLEGSSASEQSYAVQPPEGSNDTAELTFRLEPTRISRDFQFRIRANDADSGWQSVQVSPPPVLVPLDGRPSPQIRLDYPAYTDLPPADLKDGTGLVECVSGTRVTLRAATDRPVARASIGFRPDQPVTRFLPALSAFGSPIEISEPGFELLASEVWMDVPVQLARDGTLLEVSFVPRVAGPYALRFEDDTGLGTTRIFDVRVHPDLAPTVTLLRPSGGKDSLLVLPDAEITFEATILDKQYAIRSVWLESRTNQGGRTKTTSWFDSGLAGQVLPGLAGLMHGGLPIPLAGELRLRPQQLGFVRRLSLRQFQHADGSPLAVGDVLILQVAADDFDDVTGFKSAGKSHEVELVIVAKQDLDAVAQQAQSDLRAELLRLHALQREARTRVQEAMQQARNSGQLRPEDLDRINRAEQTQQQIRNRINADDGLRKQLERLRQSAKDNHLPRSSTTDRLDEAAAELTRLANEELEPLEAELASAKSPASPKENPAAPLARAEKRQKEVEQTMLSLLEKLEPWSGAGEIRGETRSVLNDLKRQMERNGKLPEKVPPDSPPQQLTPEQKTELDRAAVGDERVAERGRQLVERMNRLAVEKEAAGAAKLEQADRKDLEAKAKQAEANAQPAGSDARKNLNRVADELGDEAKQTREAAADLKREADSLKNAATLGNSEELKDQLRRVGPLTRENQGGRAANEQKAAAANLERMLNTLEEQQAEDSDRMTKKLKDTDRQLDELIDQQEKLQKKTEAAQAIKDPGERAEELKKLSREQEKLEAEARDLAQRLTREKGEQAGDELRRAAREMSQAREKLENGEAAAEKMDDVLERLDEAQRELDQARQKNDEELQREQAAKFADELKALRDREQRLLDETGRIHAAMKKAGKWERPLRTSLNDLKKQQNGLGGEVKNLIEKKFKDAAVFGRMLRQSADAMELASKRIDSRLDAAEIGPFDMELEEIANTGILSQQQLSLKRIDQLLESLKPDQQAAGAPPMGGGMPPEGPPMENRKPGDQLPPLAQLKALRGLQADIAERTEAFDKAHTDRTKLNDDEIAELEALEKMQRDVAELIKELSQAAGM